jgi:hypothetical protein
MSLLDIVIANYMKVHQLPYNDLVHSIISRALRYLGLWASVELAEIWGTMTLTLDIVHARLMQRNQ